MPLYNYFNKFGTVSYNNNIVSNIISSVRFKQIFEDKETVFYPYVVEEGERPDQIAAHYYEDERYSWLVYLCNQIVDPYFEWHLTVEQFREFIIKKYGSVETAQSQIAFYRNNWYSDDSIITSTAFNALTTALKKYWNPIVGYSGSVNSYDRKRIDIILETNKVIEVTLNNVTGISEGDKVIQKTSGTTTGSGYVRAIKTTSVVLNHIVGAFANTAGSVGSLTNANTTYSKTVSNVTTINTPISATEAAYWEAIDSYTYESEINESRKTIRLIDKQYVSVVEDQMIELLT